MKALQCDCSAAADAYVEKTFTPVDEVWLTLSFGFHEDALELWISDPLNSTTYSGAFWSFFNTADVSTNLSVIPTAAGGPEWYVAGYGPGAVTNPTPTADVLHVVEYQYTRGEFTNIYVDDELVGTVAESSDTALEKLRVGQWVSAPQVVGNVAYINDVSLGTARGETDVFSDDFEGGDTSAWDTVVGDVQVIDGPTFASVTDVRASLTLEYGLGYVNARMRPAWVLAAHSTPAVRIDPITGRETVGAGL